MAIQFSPLNVEKMLPLSRVHIIGSGHLFVFYLSRVYASLAPPFNGLRGAFCAIRIRIRGKKTTVAAGRRLGERLLGRGVGGKIKSRFAGLAKRRVGGAFRELALYRDLEIYLF